MHLPILHLPGVEFRCELQDKIAPCDRALRACLYDPTQLGRDVRRDHFDV